MTARALAVVVLLTGVAHAGPGEDFIRKEQALGQRQLGQLPPDDEHAFAGDGLFRPPIEWSTWVRAAYGIEYVAPAALERSTVSPRIVRGEAWDLAVGIEASLPLSVHGDVRLGAWFEQRSLSTDGAFAGGELVLTRVPKKVDMFMYEGHGILALRAGRNTTSVTAALAYGYLAPYWLEGPCRMRFYDIDTGVCAPRPERTARYMAGVRVVGTVTRDLDDPRIWSATLGIELEPVGALRMMTIARSWY